MKLAVFLCISFVASSTYSALIGSHSEILTVAQFLDKIPDVRDNLDLKPSFLAQLGNKIAEYEESVLYFDKGECIILEGAEKAKHLYFLESGTVEIFKTGLKGRKSYLDIRDDQFTFGELALLRRDRKRSASVCTRSHVTVRKIPYHVVKAFMNKSKKLSKIFAAYLNKQFGPVFY